MLYLYTGTDRMKARAALGAGRAKLAPGVPVIHITDIHTTEDLDAALAGGGMFAGVRAVVLDELFDREEMRERIVGQLERIASASDHFFIYVEKLDAATRRQIEKHTTKSEQFDLPKKADRSSSIFNLGNALRARNKKDLWVSYQRELANDAAPEAIHGVLFWAAKQMLMSARSEAEAVRGKKLIATLAALPHEARRQGVDLEYALERFVLSGDVVS
ncbi:hypothetical protein HZC00_01845 [Candidatus Kaiserbacteria bacterium]|nr:hypothetical protein [Candidatus Kaiserbacteria bacterium]